MNEKTLCCIKQLNKISAYVLVGNIASVWWCTWDSTLKNTKVTDVVCRGSIHPSTPFPLLLRLLQWCKFPPGNFFFLLALKFTNNVLVTYFSLNSFPPSVFRAGHVLSGRGKYWKRRQGERKTCLTGFALHSRPLGIHSTRAGVLCWLTTTEVHHNSSNWQLASASFYLLTSTSTSH